MGAGVLSGLGGAITVLGEDLGEKLKEERLQKHKTSERKDTQAFRSGELKESREHNADLLADEKIYEARLLEQKQSYDAGLLKTANTREDEQGIIAHERSLEEIGARGSSSSSNMTANERNVRAMVEAGYVADAPAAWDIINKGSRGQASVSDARALTQMLVDGQNEQYLQEGDEGYRSPTDIFNDVAKSLNVDVNLSSVNTAPTQNSAYDDKISKIVNANPGWDIEKAKRYLEHLNK